MESIFWGIVVIIIGAICFLFGKKSDFLLNIFGDKKNNINWKPVKNKPDRIEVYQENEWKEIKLPKNNKGKQIESKNVEAVGVSQEGEIDVKIIEGITDRRNIHNSNNK
jgi:hypothetical protein